MLNNQSIEVFLREIRSYRNIDVDNVLKDCNEILKSPYPSQLKKDPKPANDIINNKTCQKDLTEPQENNYIKESILELVKAMSAFEIYKKDPEKIDPVESLESCFFKSLVRFRAVKVGGSAYRSAFLCSELAKSLPVSENLNQNIKLYFCSFEQYKQKCIQLELHKNGSLEESYIIDPLFDPQKAFSLKFYQNNILNLYELIDPLSEELVRLEITSDFLNNNIEKYEDELINEFKSFKDRYVLRYLTWNETLLPTSYSGDKRQKRLKHFEKMIDKVRSDVKRFAEELKNTARAQSSLFSNSSSSNALPSNLNKRTYFLI